jgi:hypothetical protein
MDTASEINRPNNAMHTNSAMTLALQSTITGAEPVMANR